MISLLQTIDQQNRSENAKISYTNTTILFGEFCVDPFAGEHPKWGGLIYHRKRVGERLDEHVPELEPPENLIRLRSFENWKSK